MQKPTLLTDALAYSQQFNLSVLPTEIKSKRPTVKSWSPFQKKIATELQIKKMFSRNGRGGIAGIGGAVSGNLECIDFDEKAASFDAWRSIVEKDEPELIKKLVIQKTQNGGIHVIYRCESAIPGASKLAKSSDEKILIETRGEGNYFLMAPTPGYELLQGDFSNIPVITKEQRDSLNRVARLLNEWIDPAVIYNGPPKGRTNGLRPGDVYNERQSISELIEAAGWIKIKSDGRGDLYRRPGKNNSYSARIFDDRILYNFSSNATPFEPDKAYTPFSVYTFLNHDGDFSAAAKELRRQGYGDQTETPAESPQPSEIKIISLSDIEAKEFEDKPLIDEFLDEREGLGIIAPGGLGKSLMANEIALSCAVAKELFDLFEIREPFNTLIVQSENTMKATNLRLRGLLAAKPELKAGAGKVFMASVNNDVRLTGALTNNDFQKKLVDLCHAAEARVLALDPLISYHDADENDNSQMRKALDCLTAVMDAAKVATIITHHTGKSKTAKSGRGASAIFDWLANLLVLEKVEGSQDTILVKHEKARNFALKPPFYLKRVNFGFYRTDWIVGNRENIKKAIATLQRLDGVAESKMAFVRAFVDDHNLKSTTARNAIDAAHKSGVFKLRAGKGQATCYEFNTENIEKGYLNDVIEAAKSVFDGQGCRGVQEK
jgi:hypothetical protein